MKLYGKIFTVAQPAASFQEISSYQAGKVGSNDFKNSRSILTKHDVSPIRFRWPIVPGIERPPLLSVCLRTPGSLTAPSWMEGGVEGGWFHLFRLAYSTMTNLGFRNAWQKTVTVAAPFGCRSRLDRTSSHRIRGVAGFNPYRPDCPYCPVRFEVMEISKLLAKLFLTCSLKDFIVFRRNICIYVFLIWEKEEL